MSLDRFPFYLAPMASFTEPPMRVLSELSGADRTYTEMVNADGLIRHGVKTRHLLDTLPEERHVYAHLYGHTVESLGEATAYVASLGRFEGIDLNAGCPVPRITKLGAGSALIKDPAKIGAIVSAMVHASGGLPVTVKTRLGPHPQDIKIFEILRAVEDAGASALSIHARFTSQGHSGETHLDILQQVKDQAKIPIYGNGSIKTFEDAKLMQACGVDGILIARGALGNPWVFSHVRELYPTATSIADLRIAFHKHLELQLAYCKTEALLAIAFRVHLFRYLKGLPGSSHVRGNLMHIHTYDDIIHAAEGCFEQAPAARDRS